MTAAEVRAEEVERALRAFLPDARVMVHESLDSTIDACRAEADRGAAEGLAVVALSQRRGRGTSGHAWHSPRGGLHVSLLLGPDLEPARAHAVRHAAGVAACLAARAHGCLVARLKEPNDLVVADAGTAPGWRKLGGVLVDAAVQGGSLRQAIVSLGLNVNAGREQAPPELRAFVTSLSDETGTTHDLTQIAADVLGRVAAARAELVVVGGRAWAESLERQWSDLVVATPGLVMPEWAHAERA